MVAPRTKMKTPSWVRPSVVRRVLRPASSPLAVLPAVWTVLAGAVVIGVGLLAGLPDATGLAYFGVTCAALFLVMGPFRARAVLCVSQGLGAAFGIVLGVAVSDSVVLKIAVAAVVALPSGMVGPVGRASTAAGLMAVIGLAFGEFGRVPMTGWVQALWYLAGTGVVLLIAVAGWPLRRDRPEWQAVATVFDSAARLMGLAGSPRGPDRPSSVGRSVRRVPLSGPGLPPASRRPRPKAHCAAGCGGGQRAGRDQCGQLVPARYAGPGRPDRRRPHGRRIGSAAATGLRPARLDPDGRVRRRFAGA